MEHITIPIVIDTKATGTKICKTGMALIITPTETYIREIGAMASSMDKATIFILKIKRSIKVIGRMEKRRGLESLLLKINMAILGNGKTTERKERGRIYIQTDKDTKDNGIETRNMEMDVIGIKMETAILAIGKTIIGMAKVL